MFKNANFELLKGDKVVCQKDPQSENLFSSTLQCEIRPPTDPQSEPDVNLKTCRTIEIRLADKIPVSEWNIAIKLTNNEDATFGVSVEGNLLKMIHSLMSYNLKSSRLKLQFHADVHLRFNNHYEDDGSGWSTVPALTLHYATVLNPSMTEGEHDHFKYSNNKDLSSASFILDAENKCRLISSRGGIALKNVTNVRIFVGGIGYADLKDMNNIHANETRKFIHRQRISSDPIILCKPDDDDVGDMQIQANGTILCAQSSVIKNMLEEGKFKEGTSRRIPMTDRTQKEVASFLDFLYYGIIPSSDPSIAVTLYEMGHYYDVNELEKTMKELLLSRPAESFKVEAAVKLFKFAHCFGDMDLKQMAVDVLKMYDLILCSSKQTDEDFQSGIPLDVFQGDSGAIMELFRMYGRF